MDVVATNLHLYGQYPLVISLLCLHWVIEQDKALKNIRDALKDSGLGYLFISAKSSIPSKNPGYIEIIHQLIKEDRYASYFSGFSITRANLTKENYPSMIEKAGLQLNELIEIKEPFVFEDRKELSRFFQRNVHEITSATSAQIVISLARSEL
jgi:SAM-dependent methyltransferase